MNSLQPRDADFAARVRASFAKQTIMETIGASLLRVAPGEVDIALKVAPHLCQQHGFVHAGVISIIADSACGYAAFSLMPAGIGILTVEFKINLLAPAAGERLIARAKVIRAGRAITVAQAHVTAEDGGEGKVCAVMTGTLMGLEGRTDLTD